MTTVENADRALHLLESKLGAGGLTVAQVALRLRLQVRHARYALQLLRTEKRAHVDRWLVSAAHGPAAIWVAGEGEDCPMPLVSTHFSCPTCGQPVQGGRHA